MSSAIGYSHRCGSVVLSLLCVCFCGSSLWSQEQIAPSAGQLQVLIEKDKGGVATHPASEKLGTEMVIVVTDEEDLPVPGATVTVTMPMTGASAVFANGSATSMVQTDETGTVKIPGIRRRDRNAGQYTIRINAAFEGKTGTATATHTNEKVPNFIATKKGAGIVGAVVAGVVVPVVTLRKPPPPSATISSPVGSVANPAGGDRR